MDMFKKKVNTTIEPIAVVGVGALFPGSQNAGDFWKNIVNGRDLIKEVPSSHWLIQDYYDPDPLAQDKTYCKRGAFLDDIAFDPIEYGVPPQLLESTDTAQLLALIVAKAVLNDVSDGKIQSLDLKKVSVILGSSTLEAIQFVSGRMQRPVWNRALQEFGLSEIDRDRISERIASYYTPWHESTFPGLLSNVVSGRIANRFNLGGTNCTVDAACAGSLAALSMAVSELQLGQADMVITGGVDTLNDIIMFMCFSKTQALSRSGDCMPFSKKADGTVLGEGLGLFALKRLTEAEKAGNKIYALIRGIGTSSDGRSKSIYAPVSEGQSRAILRAYDMAGYTLDTVELIEAHGTGTVAGDAAELKGLQLAFDAHQVKQKHTCRVGSVKSQIGHTKSAAGAAGLIKTIMSLHHQILPPTLKADEANTSFDWKASPFYLANNAAPWLGSPSHPRRAGVSSFGFGGSNYHIALEEYQGKCKPKWFRSFPTEIILFTGDRPTDVIQQCEILLTEELNVSYQAYVSQKNSHPRHLTRLAIVAQDEADLRNKIIKALTAMKQSSTQAFSWPEGVFYGHAENSGKLGWILPNEKLAYLERINELIMGFSFLMPKREKTITQSTFSTLSQSLMNAIQIYPDQVFDQPLSDQAIRLAHESGIRTWLLFGSDDNLINRIQALAEKSSVNIIPLLSRESHSVTQLWYSLAQLTVLGLNLHWMTLWEDYGIPAQPVKKKPHDYLINGTNYGRPYPTNKPLESFTLSTVQPVTHETMEESTMSDHSSLIKMVQELQKQMVDAHTTYQKVMADSHTVFLNSINQLAAQVTGALSTTVQSTTLPTVHTLQPSKLEPVIASEPVQTNNMNTLPAYEKPSVPLATSAQPSNQLMDLKQLLMTVVSEKTGYPSDMLTDDMAIEADLGIDSIKRVEILSALTERVPGLPEFDPEALAELRTLGHIVSHVSDRLKLKGETIGLMQ